MEPSDASVRQGMPAASQPQYERAGVTQGPNGCALNYSFAHLQARRQNKPSSTSHSNPTTFPNSQRSHLLPTQLTIMANSLQKVLDVRPREPAERLKPERRVLGDARGAEGRSGGLDLGEGDFLRRSLDLRDWAVSISTSTTSTTSAIHWACLRTRSSPTNAERWSPSPRAKSRLVLTLNALARALNSAVARREDGLDFTQLVGVARNKD
jgi:hypothetical protein